MPAGEEVVELARHGTTMALFLSAARSGQLQAELLGGGYPPETPVVVAYQATWPDELIVHCTVGTLAETVKSHRLWKHTLFLVGPALAAGGTRSHLYHPGHFHGFRRAQPAARRALREGSRECPHRARAARAGPAAHREGPPEGAAHRLDDRHLRVRGRQGRGHRAARPVPPGEGRGRAARRPPGQLRRRVLRGRRRGCDGGRGQGRRRRPGRHPRRAPDRAGSVGGTSRASAWRAATGSAS